MFLKIIENIICGYILFKFGLVIFNIIYYCLNKMIFTLGCYYISYKLIEFMFDLNIYIKNKYNSKERDETYALIFSTLFGFVLGFLY